MGLLLIDIGRGTQDILLHRPGQLWENSIQLILPSPTNILARLADRASSAGEDLFFTGETMGGGPLTKALQRHMKRGGKAWATPRASATFDDDPGEVKAMGVEIVGEEEEKRLGSRKGVRTLRTGDVDVDALEASLAAWGISFGIDAAAVAVQDHGKAPPGMSDRRFRFAKFRERVAMSADLTALAFTGDDLPDYLTRMQGVRRSLKGRGPLLLMDTGFAALLGALSDPHVGAGKRNLLLNIGNGHTLAGVVEGLELAGLFEHHTARLDGKSLLQGLDGLVVGDIGDDAVYGDGGHGAFVRREVDMTGWEGIDVFAATGPRRSLAEGMPRSPYPAAPFGQMMLTGNCGLFRAWGARLGEYTGE